MTLDDKILDELYALAVYSPNKEVCGVVDTAGFIHQVTNDAKGNDCFLFNKLEYLRLLVSLHKSDRAVFCIFHTHTSNSSTPSKADEDFAKRSKFPSLIVTKYEHRWVT